MTEAMAFRDIRFTAATDKDREAGLLGFVEATFGPLRIEGIAVRRKLDGGLALSFPVRKDRHGRDHPILRPLGDRERQAIEHEILGALMLRGVGP